MRQIKYFSTGWNEIESIMNTWIKANIKTINIIYKLHINQEVLIDGTVCVNGFIDYETIGGK